ncbi:hypothetical protein ACJRO7_036065 [Eucalyptus globulus]|uniref:Uncharacterized protein n=1 Tax=Eucalyptus globulus TaxID=34317 RepID=A0ABD3J9G1_EUCGL
MTYYNGFHLLLSFPGGSGAYPPEPYPNNVYQQPAAYLPPGFSQQYAAYVMCPTLSLLLLNCILAALCCCCLLDSCFSSPPQHHCGMGSC